jgi:serine-type D-Ala-D-Ala carboxypeptidase/endopeptidase
MARYLAWQLDEHDAVVARAHALIRGTGEDGQGLIWNIGRDGNQRVLWHGGGSFGETSQMVIYPDSGDGFVLLANDACEGTEGALKKIAMDVHHAAH